MTRTARTRRPHALRRWSAVWAAIAALAILAGCGGAEEASGPEAPLATLKPVVGRDLEERLDVTGELLAIDHAEIASEVEGRISELLVDEGEAVEAGAPLLEIDPERRELELADATATVGELRSSEREARREHERVSRLHQRGAASVAQLDDAETALQTARSRLEAARARLGVAERALRDATVTAPFAGLLARRMVSRGEYVRPGTPLVELVALDPIEVEFHLPERDSARVRLGMPVDVRVAPYPDDVFRARVTMVSPTIAPSTRTLRVKAEIENTEETLRPGLFARADLGVARREGVPMLPEEAVLRRADGAVVFVLGEEDRVERRVIETGLHRDGEIEAVSGLESGDWVVVRGHTDLRDGMAIRPRGADGAELDRPLAQAQSPAAAGAEAPQ